MPLVMGVASVAAGARVEVRDADSGSLVAVGTAAHPPPGPGLAPGEQAAEVWWDAVVDAIAAADLRAEVAALAVAAQRQALVLVDGAGSPLLPASLRTDRRAADTAGELVARLGADRLARATGHRPGPDTPLARLVHVLAEAPGLGDRVDAVLGAADLLTLRLTGRRVTDRGGASGTGWWDPVAGRWRHDLLERAAQPGPAAGWQTVLPEVLGPSEAADRVSATVHELVGLRGRPLVAAGTGDLMAGALAAGVRPGTAAALVDDGDDATAMFGSSTPAADPTGTVRGFADAAGGFLPAVDLAPVGRGLATIARLLGTDPAGLAGRAAALEAGGAADRGRLVVVAGAVVGLDVDTTPGQLARAALLGAAAEIVLALDLLDRVGGGEPDDGRLVLAGAVARWPGVAAAVADLAGREVHLARGGGIAAGACAQAAAAADGQDPLEVVEAWGLDASDVVAPSGGDVDTPAVLAAYADARDALKELS